GSIMGSPIAHSASGQITGVTKATAVRRKAVFGCPHRALLKRESSARQGITSDSSDSRTSRIGSKNFGQTSHSKFGRCVAAVSVDANQRSARCHKNQPGGPAVLH